MHIPTLISRKRDGEEMGVEVHAVLNPMNEPTGRTVGNALEVIEALECLDGGGPADLHAIVLVLAGEIAGIPRAGLGTFLDDGSARRRFDQMFATQDGNPADLARLAEIRKAPLVREVIARPRGHRHGGRRRFKGGCRVGRPGRSPARSVPGEGDGWRGFRRGVRPVGQMWRAGLPDPRAHGEGSPHGGGDDRKRR